MAANTPSRPAATVGQLWRRGFSPIRTVPDRLPMTPWGYRIRVWEYLLPVLAAVLLRVTERVARRAGALPAGAWGSALARWSTATAQRPSAGSATWTTSPPRCSSSAALQVAIGEASYSTFSRFKWTQGLVGDRLGPGDARRRSPTRRTCSSRTRLTLTSAMYYLVLLVFGAAGGPTGVLMIPIGGALRDGLRVAWWSPWPPTWTTRAASST